MTYAASLLNDAEIEILDINDYEMPLFSEDREKELGQPIPVSRQTWRPGDQRVFIADIGKAKRDFGWVPKIDVETGIRKLFDWVRVNQDLF